VGVFGILDKQATTPQSSFKLQRLLQPKLNKLIRQYHATPTEYQRDKTSEYMVSLAQTDLHPKS